MEHWSPYRDAHLGADTDEAIQLAAILSGGNEYSSSSERRWIEGESEEAFAVGRFYSNSISPFIQYFEGDFETTRDLHVDMTFGPSLCVSLLFKGCWSSRVDGRPMELRASGAPMLLAYGESMPVSNHQKAGAYIQNASLLIGADFFAGTDTAGEGPSLSTLAALLRPGVNVWELPSFGILNTIFQRMRDNPYSGRMSNIYMESLALSAIVELTSYLRGASSPSIIAVTGRQELAHEARRILDEAWASPPTAEELARQLGTNHTTLRRLFKETFGISMMNYITSRRLEAARVLIRQSSLQIAEIAYRMGYSDPANFTTAYRQFFGHPPKADRS